MIQLHLGHPNDDLERGNINMSLLDSLAGQAVKITRKNLREISCAKNSSGIAHRTAAKTPNEQITSAWQHKHKPVHFHSSVRTFDHESWNSLATACKRAKKAAVASLVSALGVSE